MTTIGERLKFAREAKKVSLEQACHVTKIQRKTLEALEQDRVEEVLDAAYAKIFLKKYAAFLGVDGSALLQEYGAGHFVVPEPALKVETEVTRNRQESESSSPWILPVGAGLFALIGIATLGYFALDLYHSLSKRSPEKSARPVVVEPKRPASSPALVVPASKPLKLVVQTTADVWLQVKADGAVIFQNVLSKGAQESWTAKKELELWTGNAGAMKLTLNGKPLEGLGRGVRKGVRITHAGIVGS